MRQVMRILIFIHVLSHVFFQPKKKDKWNCHHDHPWPMAGSGSRAPVLATSWSFSGGSASSNSCATLMCLCKVLLSGLEPGRHFLQRKPPKTLGIFHGITGENGNFMGKNMIWESWRTWGLWPLQPCLGSKIIPHELGYGGLWWVSCQLISGPLTYDPTEETIGSWKAVLIQCNPHQETLVEYRIYPLWFWMRFDVHILYVIVLFPFFSVGAMKWIGSSSLISTCIYYPSNKEHQLVSNSVSYSNHPSGLSFNSGHPLEFTRYSSKPTSIQIESTRISVRKTDIYIRKVGTAKLLKWFIIPKS